MGFHRKFFARAAFFALVASGLPAFAEQTLRDTKVIALGEGQGITQALSENGCDMYWLSEVVTESNISVDDFRRLPVGWQFSVPANCETVPPQDIAENSATMMRLDIERTRTARMPSEPRPVVKKKFSVGQETSIEDDVVRQNIVVAELLAEKEKLEAENSSLAREIQKKDTTIEALKLEVVREAKRADTGTSIFSWFWITLGGAGMALLGWVGAMFYANSPRAQYTRRQRMRSEVFEELSGKLPKPGEQIVLNEPAIYVLDFRGKRVEFPWNGVDEDGNVLRKCSCGEKKLLTKNLFTHLERAKTHAELRGEDALSRVMDDEEDEHMDGEPVRLEIVR